MIELRVKAKTMSSCKNETRLDRTTAQLKKKKSNFEIGHADIHINK